MFVSSFVRYVKRPIQLGAMDVGWRKRYGPAAADEPMGLRLRKSLLRSVNSQTGMVATGPGLAHQWPALGGVRRNIVSPGVTTS